MSTANNKTAIFVPTVSEDGTKLLQNFNLSVTQSVQGGGLEFEVTRNNYTLPLDHEIKYHDQTPTQDSGVSLYVNAPTTNNNLYETIAQKFQLEVGDAKEAYVDDSNTANPVAAERPLEDGVHTVEEIYLPSGSTIDNWNVTTDYVYIKGMNGGAPFYRRFKFVGNGRDCMVGENITEAEMKLNTIRLRPSGFSMFNHIEAKFKTDYQEKANEIPTVHRIFIISGATESGSNQWDETKEFFITFTKHSNSTTYTGRMQLKAHPNNASGGLLEFYNPEMATNSTEIFRDQTLTPLQKLLKTFVADNLYFGNSVTGTASNEVKHVTSLFQNQLDPERYIFVFLGGHSNISYYGAIATLSGSSLGYTHDFFHFAGYSMSEFNGYSEVADLHGVDITVPKLISNASGGDFQVQPNPSATHHNQTDPFKLFDNDFITPFAFGGFVDHASQGLPDETDTTHRFLLKDGGTEYSYGGYFQIDFDTARTFNAFRYGQPNYHALGGSNLKYFLKKLALFGRNDITNEWELITVAALNTVGAGSSEHAGSNAYQQYRYDLGGNFNYKSIIVQGKESSGSTEAYFRQLQLLKV